MDRKEFLALVRRSALLAAVAPWLDAVADATPVEPRPLLDRRERDTLEALASSVIPAADGMPSAAEMGAVAYLERVARLDATVAAALRDAIAAVTRRSGHRRFESLPAADRVALLQAMEKDDADRFHAARDLVYEAYYTNPLVWKRLGYDFLGPDGSGGPLEPFEEALLERVRALPRLYRPVS